MSDLISREALIAWFQEFYTINELMPRSVVVSALKNAFAVNAAQIVRCKNCRYWGTVPITPNHQHMCERLHIGTFSEFYCGYAGARMDADAPERAGKERE